MVETPGNSGDRGDVASERSRLDRRALVLLVPGLIGPALDLALRGEHMRRFSAVELVMYATTVIVGGVLWGAVLAIAGRGGVRGAFFAISGALFAVIAWGGQGYIFRSYTTYISAELLTFGLKFASSVKHSAASEGLAMVRWLVPPLLLWVALVVVSRRWRSLPLRPRLAPALAVCAFLISLVFPVSHHGLQASTPDLISIHTLSRVLASRAGLQSGQAHYTPGRRSPEFVPSLASRPSAPRNVVFILNESVRSDVVCVEHDPACKATPFTNNAAPARLPLLQMRSLDSTTFISVPIVLTGLLPTATWDQTHSAPTVWEYAAAAGWDSSYWTSQNLDQGDTEIFLRGVATNKFIEGKDIVPDADIDVGAGDHRLAERIKRELPAMKEPFFAVIQLSNTHFPYWVDEEQSPFQPSLFSKAAEDNEAFLNYYRNAVHFQDRAVGDMIDTIRSSAFGSRTVIVYTSDHGEAFREHGQMAHTFSVLDEEIRVPTWVDAPAGTLTASEEANLRALRNEPVTHLDLMPTFLDLMGVWDAPELSRLHVKLVGQSLLRAPYDVRTLPLTNCSALWTCPFKNWGMIRGMMKIEAREWDADWQCFNLLDDPKELKNLGVEACGDLAEHAFKTFGTLPNGTGPVEAKP